MHSNTSLCVALALVLLGFAKYGHCIGVGHALTFELPDNEKLCFYQEFNGSKRYSFHYEVIKGGQNDVDASIESPNGKTLYKKTKRRKDSMLFETSWGTFKFCFSNEFSTFTHKVVYFELAPEDMDTLRVEAGLPVPHANTAVENAFEDIHTAMTRMVELQREYRLREALGRHMAESLHNRVQWWSILEALIIVASGCGQVIILKAFFTDKVKSKQPEKNMTPT